MAPVVSHCDHQEVDPSREHLPGESLGCHEPDTYVEMEPPGQSGSDFIPAAVADYLELHPLVFGKISISSDEPSIQGDGFRGIHGVVLAEGWAGLEPFGVWSDEDRAVLYLKNPFAGDPALPQIGGSRVIIVSCRGAISEQYPTLRARFNVGSAPIDVVFSWPETMSCDITLPIDLESAFIRIDVEIDSPKSPYERTNGVSPDHRRLGIGVIGVEPRQFVE
jgi:hypothetical protein